MAGSRLRLDFDNGAGPRVAEVTGRIEPSPLPSQSEAEDPFVVEDDLVGDATAEDAAPERDTSWPTPQPPEPDPELEARIAVLDSREIEAAQAACASCEKCLAGEPENCISPLTGEGGDTTDVLAAWRERASLGIDVSKPEVEIVEGAAAAGAWYEVVGYKVSPEGGPVVVLRPDWRD